MAKPVPSTPQWERNARLAFALAIAAWTVATAVFFFDYIYHYPIPFALMTFLMPLITCAYFVSGRRGWLGAAVMLLLSALIFFGVIPGFLQLLVGTPGLGIVDRYLDWSMDVEQGGGVLLMLTIRESMLLSAGIFLIIARLAQYKLPQLQGGAFKTTAACALLLPLLIAFMTSSGETNADPYAHPEGTSFGGAEQFLIPDIMKVSRTFDQAAGTWTYGIFFSNPNQDELTITRMWAGRDELAPFTERVTADSPCARVGSGAITFGAGCNATLSFSTPQGHNRITAILGNGARYTLSWTEQI
ncbi:MAG: DUF2955 domain-containing protein [Candidatus Aenigmarchaeota archaeon]|nr:DUF2955 domain-containing protein [Candidatus Aenigmarchaeota archaeon]